MFNPMKPIMKVHPSLIFTGNAKSLTVRVESKKLLHSGRLLPARKLFRGCVYDCDKHTNLQYSTVMLHLIFSLVQYFKVR